MEQPPQISAKSSKSSEGGEQPEKCYTTSDPSSTHPVSQDPSCLLSAVISQSNETMPVPDESNQLLSNSPKVAEHSDDSGEKYSETHCGPESQVSVEDPTSTTPDPQNSQKHCIDISRGDFSEKVVQENQFKEEITADCDQAPVSIHSAKNDLETVESIPNHLTKTPSEVDENKNADLCSETSPSDGSNENISQNNACDTQFADASTEGPTPRKDEEDNCNSTQTTREKDSSKQQNDINPQSPAPCSESEDHQPEISRNSEFTCQDSTQLKKQSNCMVDEAEPITNKKPSQVDEDSDEESNALMIDEDRRSENSSPVKNISQCESEQNEPGKELSVSSDPIQKAEKPQEDNTKSVSVQDDCAFQISENTASIQNTTPVLPPVKTSSIISGDGLRLKDLKIKLEKFKEINRAWQRRKPDKNTEKTDKAPVTPTRSNIFDALSATLSPSTRTSTDSSETVLPDTDRQNKEIDNSVNTCNSSVSDKNGQDSSVESGESQVSSVGSFPHIESTPENRTREETEPPLSEHCREITKVQEELHALNCLLDGTSTQGSPKSSPEKEIDESKEDPQSGAKSTDNDSDKNKTKTIQVSGFISQPGEIGEDQSVLISLSGKGTSEKAVRSLNPDSNSTLNKPSNSEIAEQQMIDDKLEDDEEQTMKIMEIFTVHASPDKSPRKNADVSTKDSTPAKQIANQSLLDILNKDQGGEESIRRVPQAPGEVNWRDFGVKRCQKCSFTTSDEALLRVHTCKRPSTTPGPNIKSPVFTTPSESVIQTEPRNHENKTDKSDENLSNITRKIKRPPSIPKVWKNIKCPVIGIGKNQYLCTICNHRANYQLFIGHLVEHLLEYPYTCPYCTSPGIILFQRSVDITAHINTHKEKSLKFSMFGFSSAKAILDRVNARGSEVLTGVWIDPKDKSGETLTSKTSSSLPTPPTSPGSSSASLAKGTSPVISNTLATSSMGVNPANLHTAMNTSLSILNNSIPTSTVTPGQGLVGAPVMPTAINPAFLGGITPLTISRGDVHNNPNPVVPTLLNYQKVTPHSSAMTNPLFFLVPAQASVAPVQATVALSSVTAAPAPTAVVPAYGTVNSAPINVTQAQLTHNTSTDMASVLISSQSARVDTPGNKSTQGVGNLTSSHVQKSITETSTASGESGFKKLTHPPNILQKKKSQKSTSVTVGRMRDKMFCYGCNYRTTSMGDFTGHIWEHLHPENRLCSHQRGIPPSRLYCPVVDKIITSVPVISPNSSGTLTKDIVTQPSLTQQEKTKESDILKEKKDENDTTEDGDSDCEIIAFGKPEPLFIDLTNDDSFIDVAQAQPHKSKPEEEGGTQLKIQSAFSLNQDSNAAKEGIQPVEGNIGNTSHEVEYSDAKNQEPVKLPDEKETCPSPTNHNITPSEKDCNTTNVAPTEHHCNKPPEHAIPALPHSTDKRDSMFYVCGFTDCRFSCIMSEQFKHHLLINHKGADEFPCAHCGHKSSGEEELFRHMLSHTSAKIFLLYKCGFTRCRFGTNLISEFQQHNEIFHKNVDSFTCASCKAAFPTLNELCTHFQASLLKFVQCPFCSVKSKDRRTIVRHIGEIHPDKPRQITVTSQLVCSSMSHEKRRPSSEFQHDSSSKASQKNKKGCTLQEQTPFSAVRITGPTPNEDSINQVLPAAENAHTEGNLQGSEREQFHCTNCDIRFFNFSLLSDHLISNHEGKHKIIVYNCRNCKFKTNDKVRIEDHLRETHPNKGKGFKSVNKTIGGNILKCRVCPYTTTCRDDLNEHFNAHEVVQVETELHVPSFDNTPVDKVVKFSCPVCKKSVPKYQKLNRHMYKIHPEVRQVMLFRCQICPYFSTALHVVVTHCSTKHPESTKILRLKRKITGGFEPKEVTTESDQSNFSVHWFHCDHCSYSSSNRQDLLEHLKSHSPHGEGNTMGGSSVSPKTDLVKQSADDFHIPNENIFECPHCEFSTKVRVNIYRHMKHHKASKHSEVGEKNHKELPWNAISPIIKPNSTSPGKSTSSPQKTPSPKKSVQTLSSPPVSPRRGKYDINPVGSAARPGQEFYKCRLCPFKATNVQSLYGHLRCHKSQSHLKCSYCSFKCSNKITVINHLMKDHPTLPRKYEGGGQMSPVKIRTSPNKLGKKRQLSGSSESPTKKPKLSPASTAAYECVMCGFKSKTINGLEEHFKTSHEVKAFVCSRCRFQTLKLLVMEKHLATAHNQKQMLYKMTETKPSSNVTTPEKCQVSTPTKLKGEDVEKNKLSHASPSAKSPSIAKRSPSDKSSASGIGPPTEKTSFTDNADACEDGVISKQHMKCGICSCITGSKTSLVEHSIQKHGDQVETVMIPVTVHKCVDCGIRFRNKRDAKEHNVGCIKRILKESERTAAAEQIKSATLPKNLSSTGKVLNTVDWTECERKESNVQQQTSVSTKIVESSDSQDFETKRKYRSPETFQYTCHLCPHVGSSRQRMKEHYFVHFKYYPFKCVYCSKVFSRSDPIQKHTLNVHPGKVLDSKLRRNEQTELKIEKLLKENRKLVKRSSSADTKGKSLSTKVQTSPASKKYQEIDIEKTSPPSRVTTPQPVKREYDRSNPFHCDLCDFTTSSKSSLQTHTLKHGPPKIQCQKCDYKDFFPYLMKKHYDKVHPDEELDFIRIEDDSGESPLTNAVTGVPTCTRKRKSEELTNFDDFTIIADEDAEAKILAHLPLQELYAKYQDQTNRVSYKCLICNFRAHTSGLIAAHMYKHMPKCFQCCYCSHRAYPSCNVTAHIKRTHEGEPKKFKFFKSQALHEYNQMLAKIGKLPFEMPESKKRRLPSENETDEESDITDDETKPNHLSKNPGGSVSLPVKEPKTSNIASSSINFCCHLCKFKIRDMNLFGEHLSLHQAFMDGGSKLEVAKCGFCSFSSNSVKEFNDHVSTHVSVRPFKCGHCDYSCFSKAHVRAHVKNKHPGEKMQYSEQSKEEIIQVRESTPPVESPGIKFDVRVEIEDFLFLDDKVFEKLGSGITSANLRELSADKFYAALKASRLSNEICEDGHVSLEELTN